MSAAFDTVDRDLLMMQLKRQFGLRGVVLQCFSSYLSSRTFQSSVEAVRHQSSALCVGTIRFSALSTVVYTVHCAS